MRKEINAMVKEICKREGKKVQLDAPQVREILKILAVMEAENDDFITCPCQFILNYSIQPNIVKQALKSLK